MCLSGQFINLFSFLLSSDTSINKEGIDQDEIGISLDDNEVSLNETTNEAEISLTETFLVGLKNKALTNLISGEMNGQESGPVDFSFKSRALYESFRGKPSTLERPRQKRTMNSSVSSTPVATDKICKRISYDNVLEGVKSSNGDREEDKFKKEDLPNKKKGIFYFGKILFPNVLKDLIDV